MKAPCVRYVATKPGWPTAKLGGLCSPGPTLKLPLYRPATSVRPVSFDLSKGRNPLGELVGN